MAQFPGNREEGRGLYLKGQGIVKCVKSEKGNTGV